MPGDLTLEPMHAVELIETLIDAKRLGAVIGGVEEFKPLIVSGDHIYLQKMLHLEDRFAEVLRKRLDAKLDNDDDRGHRACTMLMCSNALRCVTDRP